MLWPGEWTNRPLFLRWLNCHGLTTNEDVFHTCMCCVAMYVRLEMGSLGLRACVAWVLAQIGGMVLKVRTNSMVLRLYDG